MSKDKQKKAPFIYYVITGLIPILFFMALEWGLRIADYGKEYPVFVKLEGYPSNMLFINPEISYKYFSNLNSTVFRPGTGFLEEKPENGYRVFVLGGSSAQGFPYAAAASFPSHLQRKLDLLYPENYIEVVNLGASAINSHTLRDILPGVLDQSPDLILIYAGHNEYYGALGPGSSGAFSPGLARLLIKLREYRLVQLMENLMKSSKSKSDDNASLMQKMIGESSIELGSDIYDKGISQFDMNFSAMLKSISDSGVPVIVGTLSSNLSGHPPFISRQEDENGLSAKDYYEQAGSALQSRDSIKALELFIRAKDLDGLRFRAPQEINRVIREKAEQYSIPLVDNEIIFSIASPNGVTGDNLMCDHLHPNRRGYHLLSKNYLGLMKEKNYLPSSYPKEGDSLLADSLYLSAMPYSWYDSIVDQRTLLNLLGHFPFVAADAPNPYQDILDNDGLRYPVNSLEAVDSIRLLVLADHVREGDSMAFRKEVQVLISYLPAKERVYLSAIRSLSDQELLERAYSWVYEELKASKQSPWLSKMTGLYHQFTREYSAAAFHLELASKDLKDDSYLLLNLGFVHLELEEYAKAANVFTKVLALEKENTEAYHQRAVARFQLKDYQGTKEDMDQVISLSEEVDFLPYLIRGYAKFGLRENEAACQDWFEAMSKGSSEAKALRQKFCGG